MCNRNSTPNTAFLPYNALPAQEHAQNFLKNSKKNEIQISYKHQQTNHKLNLICYQLNISINAMKFPILKLMKD